MKKTILLSLLLGLSVFTYGQSNYKTNSVATAQIVMPVGNLTNTHQISGGANLKMEIKDTASFIGMVLYSGYNYYKGKPGNNSFLQLPALVGAEVHLNEIISVGQLIGASVMNQGFGTKFTSNSYLSFKVDRLYTTFSYMTMLREGTNNNLSTISIGVGYKL